MMKPGIDSFSLTTSAYNRQDLLLVTSENHDDFFIMLIILPDVLKCVIIGVTDYPFNILRSQIALVTMRQHCLIISGALFGECCILKPQLHPMVPFSECGGCGH